MSLMNNAIVYGEPVYMVQFNNSMASVMNKDNVYSYIHKMSKIPNGNKILRDNLKFERIY